MRQAPYSNYKKGLPMLASKGLLRLALAPILFSLAMVLAGCGMMWVGGYLLLMDFLRSIRKNHKKG